MSVKVPRRLLLSSSALLIALVLVGVRNFASSGAAVEPEPSTVTAFEAPTVTLARTNTSIEMSPADDPDPLLEAGRWEWYSGGEFSDVYSPDGVNVWAAGNGIWHSADGGATWSRKPIFGTTTFEHIRVSAEGEGFVVGSRPVVYRTEDAGITWGLTRDNGDPWAYGLVEVANPNTLLIAIDVYNYSGEYHWTWVSASWDGGESWVENIVTSHPRSVLLRTMIRPGPSSLNLIFLSVPQ